MDELMNKGDCGANSYLTLLGHRYSCREFASTQLTDEELGVILEAARKSPSARNNQPLRLCVVQSAEGLAKIDECTKCRYGAPTVIIATYDHNASSHPTPDHGPETCDFGDIDTSIALTNMENAAASLGLGSCWVGAFDPGAVRERFNVPESYRLVELFMVGHALAAPGPRHTERKAIEDFTVRESF